MNILVTGGTGMVGHAFARVKTDHNLILVGSRDYDLVTIKDTTKMFSSLKPDAVVHLAARVGGVKGNSDYVAQYFSDNIRINTNVLDCAMLNNIPKVISLLSTCIYPDKVAYPLTEEQIHNGVPHSSNFGYAYAKRMIDVQNQAIRSQYGLKYTSLIPNNLYGPNDNFGLYNSHVIPAMIRKIFEGKINDSSVVFWGDGKPLREFTFADDIANIVLKMISIDHLSPINIGNPGEHSIEDVAKTLCNILDYDFKKIIWNKSYPSGQLRKPSSNKKFKEIFPRFEYTELKVGLEKTCEWFVEKYPNVRGV
jgi:GDP-L-fucose synthase